MSDAVKLLSGLDLAVLSLFLIVFRYVFSRFAKVENRISELTEIKSQLQIIVFRLDDLTNTLNKITIIQVKDKANA